MLRTISAVVFAALIAVYGPQGRADESGSMQCMNVMKAMKFAFQGVSPRNLAYSLKREGETRYMLYVSAYEEGEVTKDDVPRMPWRLLERQGSSETYCLIGAGNGVEGLRDIRDFETNKRYGMPGSGFARCTDSSDDAMASLKIRAWANKELGNSHIQHLRSKIGPHNFTLLNSSESQGGRTAWSLLNSRKESPNEVCYYDRGDNLSLYQNFAIPPKMDFEVPAIDWERP